MKVSLLALVVVYSALAGLMFLGGVRPVLECLWELREWTLASLAAWWVLVRWGARRLLELTSLRRPGDRLEADSGGWGTQHD